MAKISQLRHQAPSQILSLKDELTAFELDGVCAYLLAEHENRREFARLEAEIKSQAVLLISAFGGDVSGIIGEGENPENIPEATGPNDPFYAQMMSERDS